MAQLQPACPYQDGENPHLKGCVGSTRQSASPVWL
jgi:hypothetical protein